MNPDNDAQATDKDASSTWNTLLSSSVAVAAITALLYLVGRAYYAGYTRSLGLNLLTSLQPGDYVFSGVELLLAMLSILGFAIPVVAAFNLKWKQSHFPQGAEWWITSVMVFVVLVLLFWFGNGIRFRSLTQRTCPVTSNDWTFLWFLFCVLMVVVTSIVPQRFSNMPLRYLSFGWCTTTTLLFFDLFGRAFGAAQVNNSFQLASIPTSSLAQAAQPKAAQQTETQVLILGSDATNLVVLIKDERTSGHPEPHYLLRSEVKSFRLIGESTINNFFCK